MLENEFSNADDADSFEDLVSYLDAVAELPAIREARKDLMASLRPRPGLRLLEAGCGTGTFAQELAACVGPVGQVIGVDASRRMIEEARRRARTDPCVEFQYGDARSLDFPDGSFDGCAIERTLIHISRPWEAVAELARVAKSGAAVAAMEADVESLSLDDRGQAFASAMKRFLASRFSSPGIGACLVRYFRAAGLRDITVGAHTAVFRELAQFQAAFAVEDCFTPPARFGREFAPEAPRWAAILLEADSLCEFFAAGTILVVAGRKP